MSKDLTVKKEIILNATISEVWDALTDPPKTKVYMFNCKVVTDWKVGSTITWVGAEDDREYVKGNIIQFHEEKFLEYTTFDPNAEIKDDPDNYVSVTLQIVPEGDKTLIRVTQGDFSKVSNAQKRYDNTILGWEYALGGLKNHIEG